MARVLVTGASGFVCRSVVTALVAAGYRVIAVDRAFDSDMRVRLADGPVEWVEADAEHLPALEADYAIHGAAITADPSAGESPENHFRANLNPALALLDWTHRTGVKRVILISSSAIFRGSAEPILTEETTPTPTGLYAVAKHSLELLARTLRSQHRRDVISVRLGHVYGLYERSRPTRPNISTVAHMIQAALSQQRLVVPAASPAVDWTFAGDIGRAFAALLAAPTLRHDLYHVTTGKRLTLLDIAHAIQQLLPDTAIEITGKPSEFRGCMISTRLADETGFADWTDFQDGLRQTIVSVRQLAESPL